ncbi:MAG: EutN/CcmL family microcompartment protein [Pseudomonadota bacterium]
MELARVIGTVTATIKAEELKGIKLMVIQPTDHTGESRGSPIIAVDTVQAGEGDRVYWVAGREAALALSKTFVAVDAAIVGIVDEVDTV